MATKGLNMAQRKYYIKRCDEIAQSAIQDIQRYRSVCVGAKDTFARDVRLMPGEVLVKKISDMKGTPAMEDLVSSMIIETFSKQNGKLVVSSPIITEMAVGIFASVPSEEDDSKFDSAVDISAMDKLAASARDAAMLGVPSEDMLAELQKNMKLEVIRQKAKLDAVMAKYKVPIPDNDV